MPSNQGERPRLLDLFSGAGGAAMGYSRAGFDVVGVDIKPQPNYPFEFIQADAVFLLREAAKPGDLTFIQEFDAIHASPVCKLHSDLAGFHPEIEHEDFITPLRPLLEATGLPWVIENVPGAPMRCDYMLCGTQFGLG